MKTAQIEVLAQITTTLKQVVTIEVPDDADDSYILEEGYIISGDLDGGDFEEIGSDWSIYDVRIADEQA